ncbi:MAG: GWxTD domain-containing protein [candidate division Zixibacteria bacterium]|nr:GWxTD domain-containing protein [candidate division Zixibacteria bacterium]
MKRRLFSITVLLVLVVSAGVCAQGPGFGGKAEIFEPILLVDWAAFRSTQPDKSHLELFYQVYNFGLQFVPDGKEFVASYEVTALVFDNDGNQVSSYERDRQIRVATLDQTRSRYDFRTSQVNLDLPPGKYNVRFALTDKGSKAVINRMVKVELRSFKGTQPQVSSLEFVQSSAPKPDSAGVFDKGQLVVVPSVSRAFSGSDDKRMAFYVEVYGRPDSSEPLILQTVLRHHSRGQVYRDTQRVVIDEPVERLLKEISIVDLVPGDYDMTLTAFGRRLKKIDEISGTFTVTWSQEALLKLDWKTALGQLGYIASSNELSQIKKAKTYDERKAAFDAFWEKHDLSPGTPDNEFKREFYRRVNIANRQFSGMRREGWRTDRGRVFIINGEPDEIEDEPYSPNYPPYQVWHYYREGRYRRFVFVDKNEDGDYRLQFPYDGLNQRPDF